MSPSNAEIYCEIQKETPNRGVASRGNLSLESRPTRLLNTCPGRAQERLKPFNDETPGATCQSFVTKPLVSKCEAATGSTDLRAAAQTRNFPQGPFERFVRVERFCDKILVRCSRRFVVERFETLLCTPGGSV